MSTHLHQLHGFTFLRNIPQLFSLLIQIKLCHADRPLIFENQAGQIAFSIPDENWETLFGDRENLTCSGVRIAEVEHTKFEAWHVLLDDRFSTSVPQVPLQLTVRSYHSNAGATLPGVRRENHGEGKVIRDHKGFGGLQAVNQIGRSRNSRSTGDEVPGCR